jgi:ABC-type amino acid transport substrate-binding protein
MQGLHRRQLLIALGLTAAAVRAQAALKVFGSDHYAPLLQLQQGKPAGLLADRLRATERLSGDRFEIELLAWPRAVALAGAGSGGLIGVSYTAERADWLDFSVPMHHDELRLLVRSDSRLQFRDIADLRGLRVGMVRGSTGGAAFDAAAAAGEFLLIRDWNAVQRLRALLAGRLDAAVLGNGQLGLDALLRSAPELSARRTELRLLATPLLRDALHLAFPKAMKATAVLTRFNAALRATA